jgi:hypothetical protein
MKIITVKVNQSNLSFCKSNLRQFQTTIDKEENTGENKGECKLFIIDYYKSLISEVDVKVEKYLLENSNIS